MTGGASSPQPSASTFVFFVALGRLLAIKGLKTPPLALLREGVKTGFDETGGGGPLLAATIPPPEYFEPDASDTFWTIDSGVRSRSERAVICT